MKFIVITVVLLGGMATYGGCESPREAFEAVKFGNASEAYQGIESLFNFGVESYPVLFEMLADDTPFFWFCGHSAIHMRNDPIKIEPDHDLSWAPSDSISRGIRVHQPTISQVAAYIVVAIELGNLNFAERCVIYPDSERALVLNEIRFLVGEARGSLLGCALYNVLSNRDIQFKDCKSNGEGFIPVAELGFDCIQ